VIGLNKEYYEKNKIRKTICWRRGLEDILGKR
jgi:hypothetical protein